VNARALYVLLAIASVSDAQTINLSVSTQKTSALMIVPVITWSTTPSGATCTAWGAWTGTKAAAGRETRNAVSGVKQYNLRCRWPSGGSASGFADLSWTPPSENTDGSAYLDAAGYLIRYGTPPTNLTSTVSIAPASVVAKRIEPLTAAQWGFCVSAINALGTTSTCSATATKTVATSAATIERLVGVYVNAAPINAPP
jgi:hypothetical protein